jgi:hypothetical protein
VRQPEYWEIEVVGTLRGVCLPQPTPYDVSLPVTATLGSHGVEVVGATKRERIDIPAQPTPQGRCGNWTAWVDHQPPGPATLHVSGECVFPTGGFAVTLQRHSPQGINPRDLLLDKIVQPPTGPATTAITRVEVTYTEETDAGFDTVTILPDGDSIPVTETH